MLLCSSLVDRLVRSRLWKTMSLVMVTPMTTPCVLRLHSRSTCNSLTPLFSPRSRLLILVLDIPLLLLSSSLVVVDLVLRQKQSLRTTDCLRFWLRILVLVTLHNLLLLWNLSSPMLWTSTWTICSSTSLMVLPLVLRFSSVLMILVVKLVYCPSPAALVWPVCLLLRPTMLLLVM